MSGVHVTPLNDLVEHRVDADCVCGPRMEWFDPDSGEAYDEPLLVHHSLDGREQYE